MKTVRVASRNSGKPDKKWVRESFGNAARSYDSIARLQQKIGRSLAERISLVRGQCMTVLDVGCGTGFCTWELAKKNPSLRFIDLDLSYPMLLQARRKLGSRTQYVCADAEKLPISTNSIELIVSNLSIQWCHDLFGVFSEFHRILKPGGRLFISSFGDGTLRELKNAWECADGHNHINQFCGAENLSTAMQNAGLTKTVIRCERHILEYSNVLDLMRELKAIGAHNVLVGRHRGLTGRDAFNRMIDAYTPKSKTGAIKASYEVLFAQARKHGDEQFSLEDRKLAGQP